MLKYCQNQSRPAIISLASNLGNMGEEGIDGLDVSTIGTDLVYFEIFVLWDALGRESFPSRLVQLLAKIGLEENDRKSCVQVGITMKKLNALARTFVQDSKRPNQMKKIL